MLRAGRFRHRLLDDAFLKTHSDLASSCLKDFLHQWRLGTLSDIEIAAIYIFIFGFLRRPQDFLGGPHNKELHEVSSNAKITCKKVHAILLGNLPEHLKQAKSLRWLENNDEAFLNFFCAQNWRSIPFSVAKSLNAWAAQFYPLNLYTFIPTPLDVLNLQARGERCITMLIEPDQIKNWVEEGRDVLGFIVHDLIHADHFFADPVKANAQIEFCKRLVPIHALPQIQTMMTVDSEFCREFHYLMSDMNSVPLHLLKTLKAILLGYFKRFGSGMNHDLSLAQELDFNEIFEQCLEFWNLEPRALEAARRLNTNLSRGYDDNKLLHEALTTILHDETAELC